MGVRGISRLLNIVSSRFYDHAQILFASKHAPYSGCHPCGDISSHWLKSWKEMSYSCNSEHFDEHI